MERIFAPNQNFCVMRNITKIDFDSQMISLLISARYSSDFTLEELQFVSELFAAINRMLGCPNDVVILTKNR